MLRSDPFKKKHFLLNRVYLYIDGVTVTIDYIKALGTKDGARFALLLEQRPKWLLLILYLRKYGKLSFGEVRKLLNLDYRAFTLAISYLAGLRPEDLKRTGYLTSPVGDPFIAVEVLTQREKYLVLTEYGRSFAEKVVDYLKYIAVKYGYVDVEKKFGVARIALLTELKKRFPELDVEKYEKRVISFEELISKLSTVDPQLITIMKAEVIDAIPVELVTPRKTYTLYLVL